MDIELKNGQFIYKGKNIEKDEIPNLDYDNAYKGTISYKILNNHTINHDAAVNCGLNIRFDCMASHDITYVGIIQTARASGLKEFPIPYVLTNCHNSLCAVGGTINEDDHLFGLSAAKKYGGIYVPAHLAVIHSYMREMMSGCGKMILGSDSHTRYGALGTMAIGEGGGELVKQLLKQTYDIKYPEIVGVQLIGKPKKGVGPQDVALSLVKATFKNGFVKNRVLEFFGDGIKNLPIEFRNGIDVMTTETTCLSSIWETDETVEEYFTVHGRKNEYKKLIADDFVYYDKLIIVHLDEIEPMIALPFHPSNAFTIKELNENAVDILKTVEESGNKLLKNGKLDLVSKVKDGKLIVDQAIIAGCAGGTFDNLMIAANILDNNNGTNMNMSVYPGSQPIYMDLIKKGAIEKFIKNGAVVKTAFCGPCFGAGDVPANNCLSIRHTTRNFESREGSKPGEGQLSCVALMDARSIAATAANGGILTSATEIEFEENFDKFVFNSEVYNKRVINCFGKANNEESLILGPNITDWPQMPRLKDNLAMIVAAVINDPVTTTDELIPSGETSSYRSNPLRLSEFTLSRKRPDYVKNAKEIKLRAENFYNNKDIEITKALELAQTKGETLVGSVIFANKPGDGSAREQAASCQRVLGGVANIAKEYATKRYRSNLINWGMIPFILSEEYEFNNNDIIVINNVKTILKDLKVNALVIRDNKIAKELTLSADNFTENEKAIILAGCLINKNRE
ncbi:MAG: hydratase [Clostridia bacterium]|nr:hydratase [Clostridia bacterium]